MEQENATKSRANEDALVDASKREVLARLGKYAAYTAPVMLITLGASGRKAEAQSVPSPESDRRLKRDIRPLTTLEGGIQLYSFRYLWSDEVMVGVMAQDLLAIPAKRQAVIMGQSGYFQVDYAKLGLCMVRLEDWNRLGPSCVFRANAHDALATAGANAL